MQNSYLRWKQFKILRFSWKMQKKNRKIISFGNFCSFFEVFTETLEQNIRKSHKNVFRWKRRQINKNEQFSNFWENQLYRKAIAFDKIGGNYALSANSIKIFIRVFLHAEFISAMKTVLNPTFLVQNGKKKKND